MPKIKTHLYHKFHHCLCRVCVSSSAPQSGFVSAREHDSASPRFDLLGIVTAYMAKTLLFSSLQRAAADAGKGKKLEARGPATELVAGTRALLRVARIFKKPQHHGVKFQREQGAHIGEPGRKMRAVLRRAQRAYFRRTGEWRHVDYSALATMLAAPTPLPSQRKDTGGPPFRGGQTVEHHVRDPPTINVFAESLAAGGSHGSDFDQSREILVFPCFHTKLLILYESDQGD